MTDGGRVARRKTFADEYLEPISTENSKRNVCDRDNKQSEKDKDTHSRNSSCSSLAVMDFSISVHGGTAQDMTRDASESPDEVKPEETKVHGVPVNFGVVVPGVYRSGYPQVGDYEYLKSLRLKTILTLVQKDFPEGYQAFMQMNGISHFVIDMQGTKKVAISGEIMDSIMQIVLDKRNYPLLIHCNHGKHRTGCTIAVVRKVMGWCTESVIREYSSYADPKVRLADIQYIQNFEITSLDTFSDNGLQLNDTPSLHSGTVLGFRKMMRFVALAALILILWSITATCIRF